MKVNTKCVVVVMVGLVTLLGTGMSGATSAMPAIVGMNSSLSPDCPEKSGKVSVQAKEKKQLDGYFSELPHFDEKLVVIPNSDFLELPTSEGLVPGWDYEGPVRKPKPVVGKDSGRSSFFMPDLQVGEKCVFQTTDQITLIPRHHYRLEMDVRGAPFTTWSVGLVSQHGRSSSYTTLWPILHSGAIPPPPEWEKRTFYFTTTEHFTDGRLSFEYKCRGTNYGFNPGLGKIRLWDLGPVALSLNPSHNLKVNPGLEMELSNDGQAPLWPRNGAVISDTASAHSGIRYYRVNDARRNILDNLAGGFVNFPCLIKVGVWVKGEGGTISLVLKQASAVSLRRHDQKSPPEDITNEWRRIEWEFSVFPTAGTWSISFDLLSSKNVALDDMEVIVIPIKLPEVNH